MKVRLSIALVALIIAAVGCGDDDPAAPNLGDLEIVTVTTGDSIDTDGYTLSIDGVVGPAIGANISFVVPDLVPGPYVVELGDIAANCTVQDDNPRTVEVVANLTETTQFDVTCEGPPGNASPVADAGPDQTVVDADGSGFANVRLDGSGSTDSDGTIVSWTWSENDTDIGVGEMPRIDFAVGVHTVRLTVADDEEGVGMDEVTITVEVAPAAISFATQIQPYFEAGQANCVQCHNGGTGSKGVNLDSYANILAGGDSGPLVVPLDSADPTAILVPQLEANHNNGPDDAGFVVILEQWIDEGALDN